MHQARSWHSRLFRDLQRLPASTRWSHLTELPRLQQPGVFRDGIAHTGKRRANVAGEDLEPDWDDPGQRYEEEDPFYMA